MHLPESYRRHNSAYAPHIYTETMFSGGQVSTNAVSDEAVLLADIDDANRLGSALWVGEWGAFENDASAAYQRQMYDLFDRHQVSSAYWTYTQGAGSDTLQGQGTAAEEGHVRAYPEAWPGEATWTWDADVHRFISHASGRDRPARHHHGPHAPYLRASPCSPSSPPQR